MIGRDEIISRISSQLTHHRLITLVGTGGIGQTSVPVATAKRLANNYEHGVWFVDLTAIKDPGLLPAAISSSVGLDVPAEDASAELLSFLSDKHMLLALDNCEHLIEAAAALALQLLRAAPYVQILATSREPLSVEGERLDHVQSLEFPPVSPGLGAAEALEYPAIQLFAERAASVLGEFEVRDIDVPIVVDICRKLDTAGHRARCRQHRCTWAPGSCLAAGSSLANADYPPPVGCAAAPYTALLTGLELSSADRGRTVGIASAFGLCQQLHDGWLLQQSPLIGIRPKARLWIGSAR